MPETHDSPRSNFFYYKMVNETAIKIAITNLETQTKSNFDKIVIRFEIDPKTLKRRFKTNNIFKTKIQLEI